MGSLIKFNSHAKKSGFQILYLCQNAFMEKHLLSKSTFIKGFQCPKLLYLYKKRPYLRDRLSEEQKAKFKRGSNVGRLAQQLFPGGIDVSPKAPSQYQKSAQRTQELILQGCETIYEATFQFDRVLVMLDILHKKEGKWFAYEVKSSLNISETYLMDASLQHYVIEGSGLKLEDFAIITIDGAYTRKEETELNKLFRIQSVMDEINIRSAVVEKKIPELKDVLNLKSSPKVQIGPQCTKPYICEFYGHCHQKLPKNGIYNLAIDEEDKWKLWENGIMEVSDISEAAVHLIKPRTFELLSSLKKQGFYMSDELRSLIGQIDVEKYTLIKIIDYKPAVPQIKGSMPYAPVPVCMAIESNNMQSFQTFDTSSSPIEHIKEFIKQKVEPDQKLITDYRIDESLLPKELKNNTQYTIYQYIEKSEYYESGFGSGLSGDEIDRFFSGNASSPKSEIILQEYFHYADSEDEIRNEILKKAKILSFNRLYNIKNILKEFMRMKS